MLDMHSRKWNYKVHGKLQERAHGLLYERNQTRGRRLKCSQDRRYNTDTTTARLWEGGYCVPDGIRCNAELCSRCSISFNLSCSFLAPGYISAALTLLNLVWPGKGILAFSPDFRCLSSFVRAIASPPIPALRYWKSFPVTHDNEGAGGCGNHRYLPVVIVPSHSRHRVLAKMRCQNGLHWSYLSNLDGGLKGLKCQPREFRWSPPHLGRPSSPGLFASTGSR